MKIAFDHQIFWLQKYGGISKYFAQLTTELLLLKQEVKVFNPGLSNAYLSSLPCKIRRNSPESQILKKLHPSIKRRLKHVDDYFFRRDLKTWKPNILHETYYQRSSVAPKGCKVVLTVYDMIHELFPEDFHLKDPTSKDKRLAVERADHLICISESTRRDLLRIFDVPPDKVSVTHLGFDSLTENSHKLVTPKSHEKPFLLFVGLRNNYKNFDRLLQAYAATNDLNANYDLIAFGSSPFSTDELERIRHLGLNQEQVRHEAGNDQILSTLYQTADAFIYPSVYEGFGLPPLEAMANNCPVISSNTSSMPEVIGDAAEFFDPLDVTAIAKSILKVVRDCKYKNELISRGIKRCKDFSWEKCAAETLTIYRSL